MECPLVQKEDVSLRQASMGPCEFGTLTPVRNYLCLRTKLKVGLVCPSAPMAGVLPQQTRKALSKSGTLAPARSCSPSRATQTVSSVLHLAPTADASPRPVGIGP